MAKIIFEHGILNLSETDTKNTLLKLLGPCDEYPSFLKLRATVIASAGFTYYDGANKVCLKQPKEFPKTECILVM